MKVYVVRVVGRRRPLFYTEDAGRHMDRKEPDERSWLERTARSMQALVQRSMRKAGPRIRKLWEWLNRRPAPDENLLRGLRNAEAIVLYHPSNLSESAARHAWAQYLNRRWSEHLGTLLWDLAISPLIAAIMVVPGPNVIGYWFVYRILSHVLAMRGVWRVRRRRFPLELRSTPVLNKPQDPERGPSEEFAGELGLEHLGYFLRRASDRRHTPVEP